MCMKNKLSILTYKKVFIALLFRIILITIGQKFMTARIKLVLMPETSIASVEIHEILLKY